MFLLIITESFTRCELPSVGSYNLVSQTGYKSIVKRRSLVVDLDLVIMSEVTITTARRCRDTVSGHLTRVEKDITGLEGKATLGPSDQRRIKHHLDQVKEDDKEFEKRHLEVLNFVREEDCESLEAEEKAYDAHNNRVMEVRKRLEELEEVEKTESPPDNINTPDSNNRSFR